MSVDGEVWWSLERCKGLWEGLTSFKRCDSPQGSVKDIGKLCQFYGEL